MADHFYASISIPTRYITNQVKEWIVSEIGECNFKNASETDGVMFLEDNYASDGQFQELENELVKKEIPFDRTSSGFCEYKPEIRYYRPGEIDTTIIVTNDGDAYIETVELRKLLEMTPNEAYLKLAKLIAHADPKVMPLEEVASEQLAVATDTIA